MSNPPYPTNQPGSYAYPQSQPNQSSQIDTSSSNDADELTVATFGQRAIAWLVDNILFGIIISLAITIATINTAPSTDDNGSTNTAVVFSPILIIIGLLIGLLVPAAYYIYFVGQGQTIGNRIAAIKVVTFEGNAPGYGKALGRFLVQYSIGSLLLIGYLWLLWDADHQTLHDKAVGTLVVSSVN